MIRVDREACGVCGRCVAFCPREALSVTLKWGRLSIDETACTSCFGGSHLFEDRTVGQKRRRLLEPGPPTWNLICIENCPVGALTVEESGGT